MMTEKHQWFHPKVGVRPAPQGHDVKRPRTVTNLGRRALPGPHP